MSNRCWARPGALAATSAQAPCLCSASPTLYQARLPKTQRLQVSDHNPVPYRCLGLVLRGFHRMAPLVGRPYIFPYFTSSISLVLLPDVNAPCSLLPPAWPLLKKSFPVLCLNLWVGRLEMVTSRNHWKERHLIWTPLLSFNSCGEY